MIDAHAHLDGCADGPPEVVQRARAAGVSGILHVGTSVSGSVEALAYADAFEEVFAILGIHPHEAGEADPEADIAQLRKLLRHPRAVAVGETGLDFYRDYAPRDAQRRLFEQHLAIAAEVGKPVVIHTRAAEEDTMAELASFQGTVVMHAFSSGRLLPAVLERGYYASFAGNLTYPNAHELRAAAREVPPDRLLVETDAPHLTPQPRRGQPNEPAYLVHTLEALAEIRGENRDELEAQLDANAKAAFSLP